MSPRVYHRVRTGSPSNPNRAVAPLVGVLVLIGITVCLAGTVAVLAAGVGPIGPSAPTASLALAVDADADEIAMEHRGGDALDATELTVRVRVGGDSLAEQPPVPFFSVEGFEGGPGGPFNEATDPEWSTGETASLRIAGTNDPGSIDRGESVSVRIVDDPSGGTVAELEATVN